MIRFRTCPRCDYWYLIKRWRCKKCAFENFVNDERYYTFKTIKYDITSMWKEDVSLIQSREKKDVYVSGSNFQLGTIKITMPVFQHTIHKRIPPKATDSDIDKLIILL